MHTCYSYLNCPFKIILGINTKGKFFFALVHRGRKSFAGAGGAKIGCSLLLTIGLGGGYRGGGMAQHTSTRHGRCIFSPFQYVKRGTINNLPLQHDNHSSEQVIHLVAGGRPVGKLVGSQRRPWG